MASDIMRRTNTKGKPVGRREKDIKKAYSQRQLSEIGAISLLWNECDHLINWTLKAALLLPAPIWLDVTTRINGLEARVRIIKFCIEHSQMMLPEIKKLMKTTYGDMALYAKYRNSIIHALTFDLDKSIGLNIGRQATFVHIMLSEDALVGFYERLVFFREELQCAEAIFRIYGWDSEAILAVNATGGTLDPRSLQSAKEVPKLTAQFRKSQHFRQLLPQLPKFPDEDESSRTERGKEPTRNSDGKG